MNERRTPASGQVTTSKAEVRLPSPDAGDRRLVLLGRTLLLLVAAAALASALALVHQRDGPGDPGPNGSAARYICPMHPEVVSTIPGDCPICKMELVRAAQSELPPAGSTQSGVIGLVERRIVSRTVRAPAWLEGGVVTAALSEDDLAGMKPGEHARFFGGAAPGAGVAVRLSGDPPERWDPSTVLVRFEGVERMPDGREVGWMELSFRPRELLVVPANAVLYSGEGAYVVAAPANSHVFTRRDVRVGRILDSGYGAGLVDEHTGAISVLSGLEEGERIVVSDTFFLDAERRLQAARGNRAEVIR